MKNTEQILKNYYGLDYYDYEMFPEVRLLKALNCFQVRSSNSLSLYTNESKTIVDVLRGVLTEKHTHTGNILMYVNVHAIFNGYCLLTNVRIKYPLSYKKMYYRDGSRKYNNLYSQHRKNHFIIGFEDGHLFMWPISGHCCANIFKILSNEKMTELERSIKAYDYYFKWMFGVKQNKNQIRQGDLLFVPAKIPANFVSFVEENHTEIRKHSITGKIVLIEPVKYRYQYYVSNFTSLHRCNMVSDYSGKVYKILIGRKYKVWNFSKPIN